MMTNRPTYLALLVTVHVAHIASAGDCMLLGSYPIDEATEVHLSATIRLRFSDAMDAATRKHLRLFQRTGDKNVEIAVQPSTDLTQASITVSPRQFLKPDADNVLVGDAAVRSLAGDRLQPFRLIFQTGSQQASSGSRLVFTATAIEKIRSLTTVTVGPDGRLYSADAFGNRYRWQSTDEGVPVKRDVIWQDERKSRQIIDLEWDPQANAERLVLWVSYAERLLPDEQRRFFSGTVSRLTITGDVQEGNLYIADSGKESKFSADGSLVLLRPGQPKP